ncbi:MAG: hypothetical protein WAV41_04275 [Microgenomates group bacterium]
MNETIVAIENTRISIKEGRPLGRLPLKSASKAEVAAQKILKSWGIESVEDKGSDGVDVKLNPRVAKLDSIETSFDVANFGDGIYSMYRYTSIVYETKKGLRVAVNPVRLVRNR